MATLIYMRGRLSKMARYIHTFATNLTPEETAAVVQQFMQNVAFRYLPYKNGEMVWKKGNGFLAAPQYIKVTQLNGQITVEAFLKIAILPGVFAGEMGLTGFFGFAIKETLRNRVTVLEQNLQQAAYNKLQFQGQFQSQQPQRPQPAAQ